MTKANNILKILIVYFIIQPNEGTILNLNNLSNLLSDTSCSTTNTTNIKMTALLSGHTSIVESLAALNDGSLASYSDNLIKIWNITSGSVIRTFICSGKVFIKLNASTIASVTYGMLSTITICDTKTGEIIKRLDTVYGFIPSLVVLNDGNLAGDVSGKIHIWNIDTGSVIRNFTNKITASLAVLADGSLACGFYDGTISILNTNNGLVIKNLTGHTNTVSSLVVLSDGTLASGSYDSTIRIWNITTGTTIRILSNHNSVYSIALLNSGFLASGSDADIKIWNIATGSVIQTLTTGHSSRVSSLVVLNDGSLASAASYDSSIRIWSSNTALAVRYLFQSFIDKFLNLVF